MTAPGLTPRPSPHAGPILAQSVVAVLPTDTPEQLAARVLTQARRAEAGVALLPRRPAQR